MNDGPLRQTSRLYLVAVIFAAVGLVMSGRLVQIQVLRPWDAEETSTVEIETVEAIRGNILDATGQLLAVSSSSYKITCSPSMIWEEDVEELAVTLSEILDLPFEDMVAALTDETTDYSLVADDVPLTQALQIEDLDYAAFLLEQKSARVYPNGQLAANVLGFIQLWEGDFVPRYGIEVSYNDELEGLDGTWYAVSDVMGGDLAFSREDYVPVKDGSDVVLTIDRNVQAYAEELLAEAVYTSSAEIGNIVVMDVDTGAIITMACSPTYDPGNYGNASSSSAYVNTVISDIFEPRSTFKPLTLAAGLEERVVLANSTYDDRGEITVGGMTIWNENTDFYGETSMSRILSESLNVGTAYVASLLQSARFYESIREFGFGERTGIDLYGEAAGTVYFPGSDEWTTSLLGSNSIGKAISVTPLQLVNAYAALANGGILMRPYIVQEVCTDSGTTETSPTAVRRVVSEQVSADITGMMANSAAQNTPDAIPSGYSFAAQWGRMTEPGDSGNLHDEPYMIYIGYGPLPDPQFVILVKLEKTETQHWLFDPTEDVFHDMAQYLVDYYGLKPQAYSYTVGATSS